MITTQRVESLVHQHCAEQGLTKYGIKFSKGKSNMGQCFYDSPVYNSDGSYNYERSRVTLKFSTFWFEHAPEEEIIDTILHEIAHAMAGPKAGHGYQWKKIARQIGCSGNRTGSTSLSKEVKEQVSKWKGVCPSGHTVFRDRLTRNSRSGSCSTCTSKFDPAYRFEWTQLR